MKYIANRNVSIAFGIAFLAAGLLGFFPSPLSPPMASLR